MELESENKKEGEKTKVVGYVELMRLLGDELGAKILELARFKEVHPESLARELDASRPSVLRRLRAYVNASLMEKIERPDGKIDYRLRNDAKILYENLKKDYYAFVEGNIKERPGGAISPIFRPTPEEAEPSPLQRVGCRLKKGAEWLFKASSNLSAKHVFLLIEGMLFLAGTYWFVIGLQAIPYDFIGFIAYFSIGLVVWIAMFGLYLIYRWLTK